MRVIFHGDDLGLTHSFNRGIFHCCRHGLLRSTCLRTNGTAFEEAVEQLRDYPELGVGVHLNIVEGCTGREVGEKDKLCRKNGHYQLDFLQMLVDWGYPNSRLMGELEADFRHQIETVLAAGVLIDHLNSHQHSHMIPRIFDLTCRLAAEYCIPWVRNAREYFHLGRDTGRYVTGLPWFAANFAKFQILDFFAATNRRTAERVGVKVNDAFIGVLHTGHQTTDAIAAGLRRTASRPAIADLGPDATIEVLLHPTLKDLNRPDKYVAEYLKAYTGDPAREEEVEALCSPELQAVVSELNLTVANYSTP